MRSRICAIRNLLLAIIFDSAGSVFSCRERHATLLSDFLCVLAPLPCNESFSYFPKGDPGTTANESLRDAFSIRVIREIRVLTICEICYYL